MRQQRVKDAEIGVSQGGRFLGKIQEVSDQNVHQDAEIISIKIFIRRRGRKDEI